MGGSFGIENGTAARADAGMQRRRLLCGLHYRRERRAAKHGRQYPHGAERLRGKRVSEEKKVAAEDVLYLTSTTLRNNVFFIKRADDIMPHTATDTEGM